jgi:hypothetical protein
MWEGNLYIEKMAKGHFNNAMQKTLDQNRSIT